MRRNLFILLICLASPANAESWEFNQLNNHLAAFSLGLLAGIGGHELGHIVVAKAGDIDVEFDGLTIVYPNEDLSDRQRLRVASAGFQAQWLISEFALRYRDSYKMTAAGDNFNAGVVWAHLGISVAYLTVLKNNKDGDIEGMSQATGISNDRLALLLAIPASLDAWRLMGKNVPAWVPTVSLGIKSIGIAAIWTF